MNVSEYLGAYQDELTKISQRKLYLLARPTLDNEVRNQCIEQIKSGSDLSFEALEELVKKVSKTHPNHKAVIRQFSKSFDRFYSGVFDDLKNYSGTVRSVDKEQLQKVSDELISLTKVVQELLAKTEAETDNKATHKASRAKKQQS